MESVNKNIFFEITQNFDFVPFTQSEGWWTMNSIKDENRFVFFVDSLEKPAIACMGNTMKRFGLKLLIIESECLLDEKNIDSKKIRDFYKAIVQTNFDMIEINSSLPYNALYEIGIRQAGFLKPAGLFSTPLSILLDLQKQIEYDKNWQKNLRRTEKYNLDFREITNPTQQDLIDYLEIHSAMVERKKLGEKLSLEMLKKLLENENFQLFFVEDEAKKRIAGLIIYVRKDFAISIYSATSLEGREKSASYFLYDNTFRQLSKKSIVRYDCGRISPAAHTKNDIFLFKDGVKGSYLLYCGEWSWYKRQIYRPLMYFVKKYLFKRVEV